MTDVQENIQVAMLFRGQDVRPGAFLWNGRRYEVVRILLVHKTRIGEDLQWHFTVQMVGEGSAKLIFDTVSLNWQLEAISI